MIQNIACRSQVVTSPQPQGTVSFKRPFVSPVFERIDKNSAGRAFETWISASRKMLITRNRLEDIRASHGVREERTGKIFWRGQWVGGSRINDTARCGAQGLRRTKAGAWSFPRKQGRRQGGGRKAQNVKRKRPRSRDTSSPGIHFGRYMGDPTDILRAGRRLDCAMGASIGGRGHLDNQCDTTLRHW
ncbi:hypothetical protein BDN72DRAFT_273924 [Pluteus cervinus]|uniref:Uncharacterized protein n=1 Tax=Pluteus cervinus TaxID=181527 RepID=A0ACD3AFC2_9AGAR|nr:hypothetical protein BDN72DRAFT_273924 [Pluteus cervinus]